MTATSSLSQLPAHRGPRARAALVAAAVVLALSLARLRPACPRSQDETAELVRRAGSTGSRTTRWSRGIIRGRSSCSRRSRRASRTAATRSRRSSSRRTRTTAPARRRPPIAACDRFIRTYPNHPNVDYAYYLKGLVYFREDQGLLGYVYELDLSEREPKAMRESFAAFKELVAKFPDSRYAAGCRRPDALPHELARALRGQGRALLLQSRRLRRRDQPRAGGARRPIRARRRTRTRSTCSRESYDKLELPQLRDDAQRILKQTFPDSKYVTGDIGQAVVEVLVGR